MRLASVLACLVLGGPEVGLSPSPVWFFGSVEPQAAPVATPVVVQPAWDFAPPVVAAPVPNWNFAVDTSEVTATPIALAAWTFEEESKEKKQCGPDCKCAGKDCGTGCVCCGKVIKKSLTESGCPDCTADDYAAALAASKRDGKQIYLFVGHESDEVKAACDYAKANGLHFAYEPRPVKLGGESVAAGIHRFATREAEVTISNASVVPNSSPRIAVGPAWVQPPAFGAGFGSSCPGGNCPRR